MPDKTQFGKFKKEYEEVVVVHEVLKALGLGHIPWTPADIEDFTGLPAKLVSKTTTDARSKLKKRLFQDFQNYIEGKNHG